VRYFSQKYLEVSETYCIFVLETHIRRNNMATITLSPEIHDILNIPIIGELTPDDINGDNARMEYYKEKFRL